MDEPDVLVGRDEDEVDATFSVSVGLEVTGFFVVDEMGLTVKEGGVSVGSVGKGVPGD